MNFIRELRRQKTTVEPPESYGNEGTTEGTPEDAFLDIEIRRVVEETVEDLKQIRSCGH